jgi:prolyl oligopeptidase
MKPCKPGALFAAALFGIAFGQPCDAAYPEAHKAPIVDDYFGTRVADPYRWLEAPDAQDTTKWVEAENALTRSFLDRPEREAIKARLQKLYDYPRISRLEKHGSRYFLFRNTGLQNQSVLFVREGTSERLLLDPNTLSPDGTVALTGTFPTEDGTRMAYALSKGGSDRQEIFVRDVATGKDLKDHILWAKFTTVSWVPDGSGFYYIRFPAPGSVASSDENYFCKIYFHKLGEAQERDVLIFERPEQKELIFQTNVTWDGRFLIVSAFVGASPQSEIWTLDRSVPGAKLRPLFRGFTDTYDFVEEEGGRAYFRTDQGSPLGRIIGVDLGKDTKPVEILAEGKDKLDSVTLVHHTLVASFLHNANSDVRLFSLDGRALGSLKLPTLGTVSDIFGRPGDDEVFLDFTSFTYPLTPYRYDFKAGHLTEFEKVRSPVDSEAYETTQVFYPSKDGTKVSLFLVGKKGLLADGKRPTYLTGYGGFDISITPDYDPSQFVWLERGGVLAVANLRGGGEYGEAWHRAGMLERKQNVFDDLISAAEWLIASGYTNPHRLAIEGASNGGLLVGAALVQRPELFGAVVCRVPVADMLRYHLFTVGRFWIPEYGSSEDAKQFPFLYRYSPYHNVKDGTAYPATLITTADTDDRVGPGLAKKFAARLQAATTGERPILIRIETKAGHGGGKPVSKRIDESADIYTFLFQELGD